MKVWNRQCWLVVAGLVAGITVYSASQEAAWGQGTRADYQRAAELRDRMRDKVTNRSVKAHWLSDGERFWYLKELGGGRNKYVMVDARTGESQPAFDHEVLARKLSAETGKTVEADSLALGNLEWKEEGGELLFRRDGREWSYKLAGDVLSVIKREGGTRGAGERLRTRALASTRTGEETELTILNQTTSAIEVFWLDSEGAATVLRQNRSRRRAQAAYVRGARLARV